MTSNYLSFVPREKVTGLIEGHDFGYGLSVIARAPWAMLIWNSGTSYTSGRRTCYGPSELVGFPDRTAKGVGYGRLTYRKLGHDGGRLSVKRIEEQSDKICKLFRDEEIVFFAIVKAVRTRQTLLIAGGGGRLCPRRGTMTPAVYIETLRLWNSEYNKGFICEERD